MDSITTGLSQGDFHRLGVLSNGVMTDILTLIGAGGGGSGITDVTTQSPLLTVTNVGTTRDLSLNLSTYSSTVAMNSAIASALASYVTSTALSNALSAYTDTTSLTTLLALKQAALTAGAGIFLNGATLSSYTLRWNGLSTPTIPTIIQELHWDNYTMAETVNVSSGKVELTIGHPTDMASQTWANTQLANKQDSLAYYSESVGAPTYYVFTDETATPPLYLAWASGTYVNNVGSQLLTLTLYHSLSSLPTTGQMFFSMDLQAGTTNEVVLSTNDNSWSNWAEVKFSGLNANWQTHTWQTALYPNGFMNFHLGVVAPASQYTQALGTINLRNLRISTMTASSVTISRDLTVQNDITCVSLTQTSDESIKQNIGLASLEELQRVFDAVSVKTYDRVDIPGDRVGFVAQDLQAAISVDSKLQNIVNPIYSTKAPLLGLDYARLVTVLWGVCKNQQAELSALTTRMAALESKKRKS